eukprot:Platyproteum_vivax@DN12231_c0_g1_i1.p1
MNHYDLASESASATSPSSEGGSVDETPYLYPQLQTQYQQEFWPGYSVYPPYFVEGVSPYEAGYPSYGDQGYYVAYEDNHVDMPVQPVESDERTLDDTMPSYYFASYFDSKDDDFDLSTAARERKLMVMMNNMTKKRCVEILAKAACVYPDVDNLIMDAATANVAHKTAFQWHLLTQDEQDPPPSSN